jgi:hypothetical protein
MTTTLAGAAWPVATAMVDFFLMTVSRYPAAVPAAAALAACIARRSSLHGVRLTGGYVSIYFIELCRSDDVSFANETSDGEGDETTRSARSYSRYTIYIYVCV